MGTRGISIVELDVEALIATLNKAYADEWLAYYQYWVCAKVVTGPYRKAIVGELIEHAEEELSHANLLAERILQLGGTPILEPKDWYTHSGCGYDAPTDPFVKTILEQNIRGEQCAIGVYSNLVKLTAGGKDSITHGIALRILADEVEHEDDLQSLLEDLTRSA